MIGLAAGAAMLVGCSDDKGTTAEQLGSRQSPQTSAVTSGGNTEVKVDGADLAGLDLNSVTCVKRAARSTSPAAPSVASRGWAS